ncbi:alpha/beta hydrolase [uncultured Rubinisphaera sp.]|uniref:alpha/beta hydrolase n=1 Tax=uncultured Rubinisphaera sp. TaxID=1678686 RepID=UPI0030D7603D
MTKWITIALIIVCCGTSNQHSLYSEETGNSAETIIVKDIPYRDHKTNKVLTEYMQERCRLDVEYPSNDPGFATIVWFHGGGLKSGERSFPERLRNHGIAIVAVNYRLFPKAKNPDYIDDAAAAVAWTFKNIESYGGDPQNIFISGHSAGGYLTSMIGLDPSYLKVYGIEANAIAGLLPLSGQTITHTTIREERGLPRSQPISDKFAPIFHNRKDCPPLILITGDRELELWGRYEENALLARLMKEAGHQQTKLYELDGFNHGTMVNPGCDLVLVEIKKFLDD